jgi:hypothetical protein
MSTGSINHLVVKGSLLIDVAEAISERPDKVDSKVTQQEFQDALDASAYLNPRLASNEIPPTYRANVAKIQEMISGNVLIETPNGKTRVSAEQARSYLTQMSQDFHHNVMSGVGRSYFEVISRLHDDSEFLSGPEYLSKQDFARASE